MSLFSSKKKKNQKEEVKKREKKEKKKREKEKERGDIHNQSINHWCLTYLSCILEGVKVVLIQVGCYWYELGLPWIYLSKKKLGLPWIFCIWFIYLIF